MTVLLLTMYFLGFVLGMLVGLLLMLGRTRMYGEWPIHGAEVWKVLTARWTWKF